MFSGLAMFTASLLGVGQPVVPPLPPKPTLARPPQSKVNLGTLFSYEDYPAAALALDLEGDVRVWLDVDAQGRVQGCTVRTSSGHAELDEGTCDIFVGRARYHPALDADGEPVAQRVSPPAVRWRMMDRPRPRSEAARLMQFLVSPLGQVAGCWTLPAAGQEGPDHSCGRERAKARALALAMHRDDAQPTGTYSVQAVWGHPLSTEARLARLEIDPEAIIVDRTHDYVLREGLVIRCSERAEDDLDLAGADCRETGATAGWCVDDASDPVACHGLVQWRLLVWRDPTVDVEGMTRARTLDLAPPAQD
ncbi:energy transducer TonB [Sphingomicrobium arenosum]|uniref:energy transducer TonB n=1 Tax=Sphingomicrobium arenosum TaxID=2233861 RepID=UPI002240FAC0|nr:energy transducer TonB [Sphingomicrobium arenosum]